MRDDLLDAYAAVDWGKAQVPVLERHLLTWIAQNVEIVVVDLNPQTDRKRLVAREKAPLPLTFNAEVGAIINSFRSSLDLLAAALAQRNGMTPKDHFPIFLSIQDFIDPKGGIESKKWLSEAEIGLIKSIKPYKGGNNALWALHQLDIVRKHKRLVDITIIPMRLNIIEPSAAMSVEIRRLEHETVLLEFSADAPEPKVQLLPQIVFREMGFGLFSQPAIEVLRKFACLAKSIVKLFEIP